MIKKIHLLIVLLMTTVAFSQTTVTLEDQCNCEVLSGTDVTAPGMTTPAGADIGDVYVNTDTGTIYFWDGDTWELTSTDSQQIQDFSFDAATNQLTLQLENGGTTSVDISTLQGDGNITSPNNTITISGDSNALLGDVEVDIVSGGIDQVLVTDATGVVEWVDKSTFAAIADQTTITGLGTASDPFKVENLSIVTAKLAADAVTNAKLADNAVQTENILSEGNDQVLVTDATGVVEWVDKSTFAAIADQTTITGLGTASDPFKVEDLSLVTDKLAADAVTNAKLADNAVQTENIFSEGNDQVLVTDATGVVEWVDKSTFAAIADQTTITGLGTASDPFKVEDLSIVTAKLAADAVTNAKLADNAVQTENILSEGNDQVLVTDATGVVEWVDKSTFAAIADQTTITGLGTASDPFKVEDLSIVTAKLAADAVTNAKLADNAVQTENILSEGNDQVLVTDATGVVEWVDKSTFAAIADQTTITGLGTASDPFKVEDLSIVTAKLAADAVTNAKLADNAVQTENILSEGNDQVLVTDATGVVEWVDKSTLVPATTVLNTSTVNTISTTVDGVTGAGVNIINSNELTLNGSNELVSTVNGESSGVVDLSPYVNTDSQAISSVVLNPNETVRVDLVDGGNTTIDIRDNDSDPTNELTVTGSGVPTGAPENGTTYVDVDSGQLYVYDGSWQQVGGSATPTADIVTTLSTSDNVTYTYTSENNTATSFDGTDDQDASEVIYDDTSSSLGAVNVQEAIEALATGSTDDQSLSLETGNILTLENGGTVNLTPFLDNTDDQTATEVTIADAANNFTSTEVEGALAELAASSTDDQQLDDPNTVFNSGTNELTIALENGGTATADLSSLNNSGTDDQTATEVAITDAANNFTSTEVEGALAELAAASTDDQQLDDPNTVFDSGTNELTIALENGGTATADLSSLNNSGTDDQTATEVAITDAANNFTSTEVEGALAELAAGSSDDQQLDDPNTVFDSGTNELTIALENGGTATADLSSLNNSGTDDQTATEVAITDAANNFTSTEVEGALAELAVGSSDDQTLDTDGTSGNISIEDGNAITINVDDADAIIGNEVVNGTDATLVRSGSGTNVDPYTLDVSADGITNAEIADDAVQLENIANGTSTGQVIQWDGSEWTLVDLGSVTVTENDGVIGNEIVDGTDGTLVRSGNGTTVSPYTLDVASDGITNAELADNAVDLENIADGTLAGEIMQWNGSDWVLVDGSSLNTDDQTATEVAITDAANNFTSTEVEGALAELAASSTDDQQLDDPNTVFNSGTNELTIALENGGTATADLSSLNNSGTDDQTATEVAIADAANNFTSTEVEGALAELAASSTDDQQLDDPNTVFNSGTNELTIALENGGTATADLSSLNNSGTDDQTATEVGIADAANNFTSTEVEGALAELAASSTDDQQLDDPNTVFNSGTNELTIALENGGTATADLSSLNNSGTDDQTATEVTIADAANNFTSTEVEGALAELAASSTDDQQLDDPNTIFNSGTNELTIALENGGTATADLSSLNNSGTDDQTATEVTIADAANNFTSTEVEGALAELAAASTDDQTLDTDGTAGNISIEDGNDITINVEDADAIIGNEVVNGTDATLVRSGSGTNADPYTLDVAADGITNAEIANDAVELENIANGTSTGQVIQWDGSEWTLVDLGSVTVTENDGVIGNEIVDGTDGTLVRSGNGTTVSPYTLDVASDGITNAELADNAVQLENVADGTLDGQIMQWNGSDWILVDGAGLSTDDQTATEVTITDAANNFTSTEVEGALAELAAASTDDQNLSLGSLGVTNESVEVAIENGSNVLVDIRDEDSDPTNEIELPTGGSNGQVLSTDGSGIYNWVNADSGPQGIQGETGAQGEKGDTGDQGIQGIQGETGAKGDQGDQGIQGIQGETGVQGEKGDQGDQGIQGIQGETGAQGEKGDQGDQGIQGIQGETGAQGEKGDQGDQGIQGIQGETGAQGLKGDTGDQGIQGEKGDTGDQGIQGVQGETGAQGLKGDTGDQGIQGIQGETGAKGDQGDQGIQGIQGETGVQGEKGDQGDQGIQGIQGETGAQGEKGDQGDQGIQGIQGIQGETGAQGLKGDQGDQGIQGIQGETGAQGEKGDTGDQGIQGIQGETGAQGEKGDQGDQGIQGIQGETGAQGDQGDQGIQGIQGETGAQGEKGDQGDQGIQGIQGETGPAGVQGQQGPAGQDGQDGQQGPAGQNGQDGQKGDKGDAGDPASDDQTLTAGTAPGTVSISGGNSVIINVNDADFDPTNEYNTAFAVVGNNLRLTDGGGSRNVPLSSLGTDDQYDDEVLLRTPIDVDEGGEASPTNETTVEEVIQAIAPITSKAARIFYPPSIAVDVSTNGTFTIDLYQEYIAQYGSPTVGSAGAPNALPTYTRTELYYYVTYADPAVFGNGTAVSGMSIDANGNLTYQVQDQPTDYNSLINVVFVVK
ncbi:hypothetical protein H0I23_01955 [Cellulophaga sp. HaHaR_3_176]|uniref:hypothetical protein n=1 Tax=Cellulophaga sp. HaHaR_3_176 TaxID=1942464 RepID=UPI001C1FC60C|nr:hypothetical protein [Cellulophaga sp. HaHaR_3_176]QWX82485.1 hypothetical protein H0I23_01955 [Cellulophaga sp. HaHaR_3_176]